jgi:tagatose-1,6-bisphosphate aldolase non-catalytic subunit AgaZ/GatZ
VRLSPTGVQLLFSFAAPGLQNMAGYQTREALCYLVRDHFVILKVGPALAFAFCEAIFALSTIEEMLLACRPGETPSRLVNVLDRAMLENPTHWAKYYTGSPEELIMNEITSVRGDSSAERPFTCAVGDGGRTR